MSEITPQIPYIHMNILGSTTIGELFCNDEFMILGDYDMVNIICYSGYKDSLDFAPHIRVAMIRFIRKIEKNNKPIGCNLTVGQALTEWYDSLKGYNGI